MFEEFPKIPRLNRDVVATEKLDGCNVAIVITDLERMIPDDSMVVDNAAGVALQAYSRNRLITPTDDCFGFARWAYDNAELLVDLGHGRHSGEWWGRGIGRGYKLNERRFSLFNTSRWVQQNADGTRAPLTDKQEYAPACCHVVPVIFTGGGIDYVTRKAVKHLRDNGSLAAPGFKQPEGVITFHTAAHQYFKTTLVNDAKPKSQV